MGIDLKVFDEMTVERKELSIEQVKERFLRIVKPAKGLLWHYTSIEVLEFFLKGEISFTHYKFLNDDEEVECGIRLLKKIAEEENSDIIKESFVENSYFPPIAYSDTYLFCLSKDGDSLYQWRSYTPKGGIAIEFDKVMLFESLIGAIVKDETLMRSIFRFKLAKCRYSEVHARRVLMLLIAHYEKSKKTGCFGGCKELDFLFERVMRILLTQKNPSFSFEEEERLLLQGELRSRIEFIAGKPRIVLRNPDIAKAIKTVRLSPHGDVKRNRLLVEMMRDKYGLQFDIDQSKSPYNGM